MDLCLDVPLLLIRISVDGMFPMYINMKYKLGFQVQLWLLLIRTIGQLGCFVSCQILGDMFYQATAFNHVDLSTWNQDIY